VTQSDCGHVSVDELKVWWHMAVGFDRFPDVATKFNYFEKYMHFLSVDRLVRLFTH